MVAATRGGRAIITSQPERPGFRAGSAKTEAVVESGRRKRSCRPRRPPPPQPSLSLSLFRDLTLRFPTASGAPPAAASSSSCRVRLRSGAASFSCLMFSMLSSLLFLWSRARHHVRPARPRPRSTPSPLSPRHPAPPSLHLPPTRRAFAAVRRVCAFVVGLFLEQRTTFIPRNSNFQFSGTFPSAAISGITRILCRVGRRAVVGSRRDEEAGLSPGRARPLRTSVTTTT